MSKNKYKYSKVRISGKKIYVHRLVMEKKLGRSLEKNEHVYHLDGDSLNNNAKNLIVIPKKSWKD